MMRRLEKVAAVVAAAAVAASLAGCGLHGKPSADRAKTSPGAPSEQVSGSEIAAPGRVVAPGIVESWGGDVELSAPESGWIARILVAEGQRVEAGQLLAQLDDDSPRAAVDVAKADLAEAEALLARTMRGATPEELALARADAEASRVRAALAQRDAERSSRLGDVLALSSVEVDRATADAAAQSASARAADARRAVIERGPRTEDRAVAQSRVAGARARLAVAQAAAARRRVIAPVSGVVLLSRAHPGEQFVAGAAPLFVIGDTSKLQVRLEVDEIDAQRVREGAACVVRGDDDRTIADGTVFRLAPRMGRRALKTESPTARSDVRVREVFVEVPATASLVPGQRVWGRVTPSSDGSVLP